MKLQIKTLVLVLIALGLAGGVYFYERRVAPTQSEQSEAKAVFSFKEEQVQSFRVKTGDQTLVFERQGKSTPAKWMMKSPQSAAAEAGAVAFLLNLLATGRSDRTLTIAANQKQDFGLAQPTATIEVTLDNKQTHRLVLGKSTFDQANLYAQADPSPASTGSLQVLILPADFQNAVNRPLDEWKAKN